MRATRAPFLNWKQLPGHWKPIRMTYQQHQLIMNKCFIGIVFTGQFIFKPFFILEKRYAVEFEHTGFKIRKNVCIFWHYAFLLINLTFDINNSIERVVDEVLQDARRQRLLHLGQRLGRLEFNTAPLEIRYYIAEGHGADERRAQLLVEKLPAVERISDETMQLSGLARQLQGLDDHERLRALLLGGVDEDVDAEVDD